jgi:hypothetical protein
MDISLIGKKTPDIPDETRYLLEAGFHLTEIRDMFERRYIHNEKKFDPVEEITKRTGKSVNSIRV